MKILTKKITYIKNKDMGYKNESKLGKATYWAVGLAGAYIAFQIIAGIISKSGVITI